MKTWNAIINRRLVKVVGVALIGALTVTGVALTAPQAIARIGGIPIEVDPKSAITPGHPLSVGVKLTAASNITITSSPAGYVSYSGYANANDTVTATTSPSASGSVTLYLSTPDGGPATATALVAAPAKP